MKASSVQDPNQYPTPTSLVQEALLQQPLRSTFQAICQVNLVHVPLDIIVHSDHPTQDPVLRVNTKIQSWQMLAKIANNTIIVQMSQ